ncbi:MAG: ElaA protein [Pseudonocardiales bacterium]|nr:ElaA protein [Pseudonocardiales bacterium]
MKDTVHRAAGPDLSPSELYGLLRLRVDVFVVEQRCAYAELDGRDLDPGTVHLWTGAGPSAYLRVLTEPPSRVRRIGRVCTAPAMRGQGLVRRLMAAALDEVGDAACVLSAQAHLTGLYGGFGFTPDGPGYDWDGVPHVPMRRAGRAPSTGPTAEEDTGHD